MVDLLNHMMIEFLSQVITIIQLNSNKEIALTKLVTPAKNKINDEKNALLILMIIIFILIKFKKHD